MKKTRKILAVLLVAAMAMSFSITAFAEAGDLASFTYDSVVYDIPAAGIGFTTAELGTTSFDSIEAAVTVVIPISVAELAAVTGTNFITTFGPNESSALTFAKNPTGNAYISSIATLVGGVAYPLKHGDELWVLDTETGVGGNVARIVFSTPADGAIGGDSSMKNPIYNVNVATTLAFAIDPLQIDTPVLADGQMSSGDFAFANASNVAVKVSVNLTATGKTGANVNFKDDAWVPTDAIDGAAKDVKLALVGAVTAGTATPTLAAPVDGTETYTQDADTDTLRWFGGTTDKKSSIEFLLAAGNGTDLNAIEEDSVGIFQLHAVLEPYADWRNGDINLAGTYRLQGFKTSDYVAPFGSGTGDDLATSGNTEAAGTNFDDWNGGVPAKGADATRADATELVGLNVFPNKQTALGFYGAQAFSRTQTNLLTVSKAASTSGYAINFNAGPLLEDEDGELTVNPIESIVYNPTSNNEPFDLDIVTYDPDAQTINFPAAGVIESPASWNPGPAFFDVTLKEDAPDGGAVTYKILLEVTN